MVIEMITIIFEERKRRRKVSALFVKAVNHFALTRPDLGLA